MYKIGRMYIMNMGPYSDLIRNFSFFLIILVLNFFYVNSSNLIIWMQNKDVNSTCTS